MSTLKFKGANILLIIAAIAAVWLTFEYFIEFSGFAVGLMKMSIGLGVVSLIDTWILGPFNTFEELKNGNVAFAIVYASLIVLVGMALGSV